MWNRAHLAIQCFHAENRINSQNPKRKTREVPTETCQSFTVLNRFFTENLRKSRPTPNELLIR
ncbi:hypothetical protein LEP1GSC060_1919 [Leptospira weilii serovar Ranarum str. ICFT]|uniref:Uncharacterized protein n=1 Tax=Leptospira weilii serovar Ranarum str. ICFT TaxID=1218598 RepID=N1WG00_9LEPT|nr:hypothetical protein LEP1GSC060_1919 [Leptospira weilii serovar Ranarum str. ICFT]